MTRHLPFVVGLLLLPARATGQDAPAPSSPAHEKDDAARATRLAEQKSALEAELAAIAKFGPLDEFHAKVDAIADAHAAGDNKSFGHPVADGFLPWWPLESYSRWHRPALHRTKPMADDLELANHPFATILDFDRQLRSHGIDLLIVAFPSRFELYPELLLGDSKMEGFAGANPEMVRFLLELTRAGVDVLDLQSDFVAARYGADGDRGDQLFLRTDQHWTPRAAELAANCIARRIAQHPWFVHGPAKENHGFTLTKSTFTYTATEDTATPDSLPERVVGTFVTTPRHHQWEDKRSPLLLLGDSFVCVHQEHSCDVGSHLFRFTGQKIDAVFNFGDAVKGAREKLALRSVGDWKGKKLVIWLLANQNFVVSPSWVALPVFPE